jgi:hypothetical protein
MVSQRLMFYYKPFKQRQFEFNVIFYLQYP